MKSKIKGLVGRELWNNKSALKWAPGMQLVNSNGNVDTSTLGYQYTIQTTTQIRANVVKQKFYRVAPADFMTVLVGTGAWMEEIKTNLTYDVAGDFSAGIISTASGPSQVAQVNVGTAPITTKIITWAKGYQWSTPEAAKALAGDNWDVISSKLEALKKHWDLGIQKIAFLGLLNDLTGVPGLLTNSNVTINTNRITGLISTLSADNFQTLVAGLVSDFVQNCAFTAMPSKFIMPMNDFVGLGTATSPGFPIGSKYDYLLNMFKQITMNPGFQILPLAYSNAAQNAGYVSTNGKNRYVLYNDEMDTVAMDIPVNMTLNPAGTADNFTWQGVGAGQFTGPTIYRPAEFLYYDWS